MILVTGQGESPSGGSMLRRGSSGREAIRSLELRRKSSAHNTRVNLSTTSKRPSLVPSGEFDLSNELTTAIMESDKALLVEAKKRNDVAGTDNVNLKKKNMIPATSYIQQY